YFQHMFNESICIPHLIVIPSADFDQITSDDSGQPQIGESILLLKFSIIFSLVVIGIRILL
ncbi:MAG: hypothetical protein ACXVB6_02410, partial [Mucilaginibacter sp.]